MYIWHSPTKRKLKAALIKYAYFAILIADVSIRLFDFAELDRFFKPLLMPVLLYYLIERSEGKIYKQHLFIAAALIMAWVGDILLLSKEQLFVISGIGAFLITQIIYFYLFRLSTTENLTSNVKNNKIVTLLYLTFYCMAVSMIFSYIEGFMKYPVGIYATVVTVSALSAFYQDKSAKGFALTCTGMTLFFVSDSVIAVDMFINSFDLAAALIMITYGIAQFLITEGLARNLK